MGIHLVRDLTAAILVVVAVVVGVCSLTLSVAAQRQGDCTSRTPDGRVLGQCTPIRQCAYFMRILSAPTVTQSDRNLLRDNQCIPEQLQAEPSRGNPAPVEVCCPLDRKDGLGAFRHPLLPKDCGAVKWERNNKTETQIKEYPWLALIEYTKPNQEKVHACGGVLISDRYVLTAAHCVSTTISRLRWRVNNVRLGEWDTMTNPDCQVINGGLGKTECAPPHQDVAVEEILAHPNYTADSISQTHDIAMLRLQEPAVLSDFVQPICLPNKQLRADELEELVTEVGGWQAKSSSRMTKNDVIIASIEKCQEQYAQTNVTIMASQLCGATNGNECRGNAGGPLMLFKNDAYLLGGVLSFGPVPCPRPGWPDIYTRVASYIDWIHENLKA